MSAAPKRIAGEDSWPQIAEAARNIRDNGRKLGELLNAAAKRGEPVALYEMRISAEFGIGRSSLTVYRRWAADELGPEPLARKLTCEARHSVVRELPATVIADMAAGKRYTIVSPTDKRIVTKSVAEMNRRELAANLTPKGIAPPKPELPAEPEVRSYHARDVIDEDGRVVFIGGPGGMIRMKVTKSLMERALKLFETE